MMRCREASVISQDILPVERWGFSYAAQMETAVIGLISGAATIAADMQPGWLTTKSPGSASSIGVGFSQLTRTLSDSLTTAVREIALPSSSRNGAGSTSTRSATSSGGAPASRRRAMSIPESGRQRHAAVTTRNIAADYSEQFNLPVSRPCCEPRLPFRVARKGRWLMV